MNETTIRIETKYRRDLKGEPIKHEITSREDVVITVTLERNGDSKTMTLKELYDKL